jgi:hypothetical protein
LPAVPFLARINTQGVCDWNSIADPPLHRFDAAKEQEQQK